MEQHARQEEKVSTDVFFALMGDAARKAALSAIHALRTQGRSVEFDYAGASLKSQMKKADKCGARFTVILGDHEVERGVAVVRDMATKEQREIALDELITAMKEAG